MTSTQFQMQAQVKTQAHENYILVSGHLCECLFELLSDGLELLLLAQKFILKPVHLQ